MTRSWLLAAVALASCAPAPPPAPVREPRPATPADDEEEVVAREAAIAKANAKPVDDKHPRIFPWAMWRERNEKWLATASDNHCDPRNRHLPRKGESECYPPSDVQLAAIVFRARFLNNDTKILELFVDRGYLASVNSDYYVSLLDADERPMTHWVHPTRVDDHSSTFVIPYEHGLNLKPETSHAAIIERITSDDRFPEDDPRSAP